MASIKDVRTVLRGVKDPELGRDLVDLGMVRDVKVEGDKVSVTLALTTLACPLEGQDWRRRAPGRAGSTGGG